jgi:predicted Fe-S protein YdhL (DUF1289 family)
LWISADKAGAQRVGSQMNSDTAPVASPCNEVCRMDEASGWCLGCLRTLPEIAAWAGLDEGARQTLVAELAQRRRAWSRLGRGELPLPPTEESAP